MACWAVHEGQASAAGGPRLYARTYLPDTAPRADVLFLHGYDDHCGRYSDTLEMLAQAGYRVRAFDFRGHGRSEGKRGACRRWSEYLDDLAAAEAADPPLETPFLLGQSHGALVAGHRVLERPAAARGLILCSTYLRLIMPVRRLKLAAARGLSRAAPALRLKSEIRPEMLSRDPLRQEEDRLDPLLRRVATPRWFCASIEAQAALLRFAGDIRTPALVLHGAADPIADAAAAREFYERLGSADKSFRMYEGMLHEPLRETGREEVWEEIKGWLAARTGTPG